MFKKLFGRAGKENLPARNTTEMPVTQFAPGTEISYHPDLIKQFKAHHASLLKLFGTLTESVQKNDFVDAVKTLQTFRRVLSSHLLEENVKLYTYLSKCVAGDGNSSELITDMKAEMGEVGSIVMRFTRHYGEFGITSTNKLKFLEELEGIGAILMDRIQREEESLYTMYLPPAAFGS